MALADKSEMFELLQQHFEQRPWLDLSRLLCDLQVGFDPLLQRDRWEPIKDLSRFRDEELLRRLKQMGRASTLQTAASHS